MIFTSVRVLECYPGATATRASDVTVGVESRSTEGSTRTAMLGGAILIVLSTANLSFSADLTTPLYKAVPAPPFGWNVNDDWFCPGDPLNAVAVAPVGAPSNVTFGAHSASGWRLPARSATIIRSGAGCWAPKASSAQPTSKVQTAIHCLPTTSIIR